MPQNEHNKIRPKGKETRFYIDNEVLEIYAAILKPHGVAVYCALARHAHSRTQECFPSYKQIMKLSGVGRRNTVRKYLKLLESIGLIEIFHIKSDRKNYYRLLDCGTFAERGISKDTIIRISGDTTSYPLKPIGSIFGDTLSHTTKSEKEITSSLEKESQESQSTTIKKESPNVSRETPDPMDEIRAKVHGILGADPRKKEKGTGVPD